jgi:hypothetical protein
VNERMVEYTHFYSISNHKKWSTNLHVFVFQIIPSHDQGCGVGVGVGRNFRRSHSQSWKEFLGVESESGKNVPTPTSV